MLAEQDGCPGAVRYTHRIALSESRLLAYDGETVQLGYQEYRDDQKRVLTRDAQERLRPFLLHILPKGFMRVRHFGFLANRRRTLRLAQIRAALAAPPPPTPTKAEEDAAVPTVGRATCG